MVEKRWSKGGAREGGARGGNARVEQQRVEQEGSKVEGGDFQVEEDGKYKCAPMVSLYKVHQKKVIELSSALARSLYNLQKSFFHSRQD